MIVAYRRWRDGFVNYSKDVDKVTDVVCIGCHNFESDNNERDAPIVLRSKNGQSIKYNTPECAGCGDRITVSN